MSGKRERTNELKVFLSDDEKYVLDNKVKASGIRFVILKAGGSDSGFYTDKRFYENYAKAINIEARTMIDMAAKQMCFPDHRKKIARAAEQQQFFHSVHPAFFFRIRFRIVPIR